MAAEPLIIAIVGAESTGKTALAAALAARVAEFTGLRCTWVDEVLRRWCERAGRTPQAHEQAAIARAQQAAIDEAAASHELVVCDTTPLMIAVYSELLFRDTSLIAAATTWHRRCSATLLTSLDLPWVADGLQRDGPHVREPVDAAVRRLLAAHDLPWFLVSGHGPARLDSALDALAPLLRQCGPRASGMFTRLAQRNAGTEAARWSCEYCDDPDCEHQALLERRR